MFGFLFTDPMFAQIRDMDESTMDFTCSIERGTIRQNDSGEDMLTGLTILPDRLPCYFKTKATTFASQATYQKIDTRRVNFVETVPKLKMKLGTDVRLATDRIVDIRDRLGNPVQPFRFEIRGITPRPGHLLLEIIQKD